MTKFVFVFMILATSALAHDQWWNGKEVDPWTKRVCCGTNDVFLLSKEQVKSVPGGMKLMDTGETIPNHRIQPSPDGLFWAFRWGKETQCFFAPVQSM